MATDANCFERVNNSKIVVEERGKRLCVNNPERHVYLRSKIDNCAVHNTSAADYVISKIAVGHLIVELKGRDVEHACTQIMASAHDHLALCRTNLCGNECAKACKKKCVVAGIVVASRYPRYTSVVAKRQEEFAKKFAAPLRVATHSIEISFLQATTF